MGIAAFEGEDLAAGAVYGLYDESWREDWVRIGPGLDCSEAVRDTPREGMPRETVIVASLKAGVENPFAKPPFSAAKLPSSSRTAEPGISDIPSLEDVTGSEDEGGGRIARLATGDDEVDPERS
jgi:hypothetical protein